MREQCHKLGMNAIVWPQPTRILAACLACVLVSALHVAFADAPRSEPAERRQPAPIALGDNKGVIRLAAGHVFRWPEGDATIFDLRQDARVQQGPDAIVATRLLVWFQIAKRDGAQEAVVDVYGGPDTLVISGGRRTRKKAPAVFRLAAFEGVVLEGEISSGDAPAPDEFFARASAFRQGKPPEDRVYGILGDIRPSAEEMLLTGLSDEGLTVTLHGNAEVSSQDLTLSADTIRLRVSFHGGQYESPAIESVYAEGVVDLTRGDERVTADSLYVDVPMDQALALSARVRTYDPGGRLPVQFGADAVRQLSTYRFAVEGSGFVTTSKFATPLYRIEGSDVNLMFGPGAHRRPERATVRGTQAEGGSLEHEAPPISPIVQSRNNLFYVHSVPLFYWPYLAKDVTTGTFLIKSAEVGSSGNLGQYAKAEWNLYDLGILFGQLERFLYDRGITLYDWSDLTLRTDYYSDRGFGIGPDLEYEGESRYGFVRGYVIKDTAKEDDRGLPVPRESRGEFTWRHREILPWDFSADFEVGYLSDRRFLRTYDRDEYDEGKDRETQVFVRWLHQNMLGTAQAKARINDFQNAVERQSLAFHLFGQQVLDSPVLWTAHADFARLYLRFDDELNRRGTEALGRFDMAHELSLPFDLGPVRVDPFVWGDSTSFTEQAQNRGPASRFATAYGARAATNFYRTFQTQNDLLDIDRLRHTVTPTAEYTNLWHVSKDPRRFIQHDEIDALDESHRVSLGLRNRLETYRYRNGQKQRTDLLTFDIDYARYLRDSGADRGKDDFVEAGGRWAVSENIELASEDNRYNIEHARLEAVNGGIELNYWQPLTVAYTHKYYLDLNTAGEPSHSVGALRFLYQPRYSRWQVEFATTYDFQPRQAPSNTKDPAKLGTGLYFSRIFEDWVLSLGLEFNQGRSNETRLTFNISPPGRRGASRKSWRKD